jgi:hypothetical protein
MAKLDSASLAALSTLLSAVVFSQGFLSNRVHRERLRALDRVLKIDEQLAERRHALARPAVAGNAPSVDLDVLDQQRDVVKKALSDPLIPVVLGMNVVFAAGVVVIASATISDFELSVRDLYASSAGRAVAAFALAAIVVATVGVADLLVARRQLEAALSGTVIGMTELAGGALVRARAGGSRTKLLREARRHAERAVSHSGEHAVALAMLAYVDLEEGSSAFGNAATGAFLRGERFLRRAIEQGPATAPMWAAWSFVAEALAKSDDDLDQAATAWIKAADVLVGRTVPGATDGSFRHDPPLADIDVDVMLGSDRHDAFGWFFMPDGVVLERAIRRLPGEQMAGHITSVIAARTESGSRAEVQVAEAIRERLDEILAQAGGWLNARALALAVQKAAPEGTAVADVAQTYLRADGPIQRAMQQELSALSESMSAFSAEVTAYSQRSQRSWERHAIRQAADDANTAKLQTEERPIELLWTEATQGGTSDHERALALFEFRQTDLGQQIERLLQDQLDKEEAWINARVSADRAEQDDEPDEERAWQEWQQHQHAIREALDEIQQERIRLERAWQRADPDQRSELRDDIMIALYRVKKLRFDIHI